MLTWNDVLVALVLFSCVPLQYLLVQRWGYAESSRTYALNKVFTQLSKFHDEYMNYDSWYKWIANQLGVKFSTVSVSPDPDEGQSPAIEVMQYNHKHGYFSFSSEPRITHPPEVVFRIGQVVIHKKWGYRGVIVGWDEIAKAPPEWLDKMHGKENLEWRDMPNYTVLVDTRDRLSPQLTYVPQSNIKVIKTTTIVHPLLDEHFEGYDGAQYVPRPWLKELYPHD